MSMESEHKKEETSEDARNGPEAECEDSKTVAEAHTLKLSSTSFLSSSSSCSSFEIEITDNIPFEVSTTESQRDGDLLQEQESVFLPSHAPQWSMLSSSPPHGTEDDVQVTSPPIQTMENSDDYDPNRIPSSIFSTKPTNASEWSIASNDSLFSLHMGNNSFSRDQMLWKSGELSRLDECEILDGKYGLPPVMEVSAQEECSVKSSNASRVDHEGSNNIRNHMSSQAAKMACTSASTLSDASGRSSKSFAFPVLVSASGKTSSLERDEEKSEEPQLQRQESKQPQKSSMGKWFSWFSCLPRCC